MSRVTSGAMGHLIIVDLRRHAARTVLTAVGIAIGGATIVALLALSAGIERSAAGLINLGGAELGMFQGGVGELTASSLPQSLVPRVKRQPGVADATPIAVATGELREKPSFLVFGVQADSVVWRSLSSAGVSLSRTMPVRRITMRSAFAPLTAASHALATPAICGGPAAGGADSSRT